MRRLGQPTDGQWLADLFNRTLVAHEFKLSRGRRTSPQRLIDLSQHWNCVEVRDSNKRIHADMSHFSNTRSKRRIVVMVLLAWVFALGSSWANACNLQDRGTHLDSGSAPLADRASMVSAGHMGVVAGHGASFDAGTDVALKVCASETQTIVKLPSSLNVIDVAMAPPVAFAWAAHLTVATTDRSALALPAPSPVLPLRTRFSRLAL